ncbi:hypothetical protein TRL7639_03208 [Falsiruegeria litorea R37]|uniref:Uncharacterized protein n=1 Tax=Falsiruegeria litorea R37 TaxID=1200284 RepID=A0A1Y5T917_9RHOB|nr:hypothetical protein [Falsiruegeria litorea]SLN58385.1 hypothetical protein TRL7639_03208 [Falsiruegeria litorea R37]
MLGGRDGARRARVGDGLVAAEALSPGDLDVAEAGLAALALVRGAEAAVAAAVRFVACATGLRLAAVGFAALSAFATGAALATEALDRCAGAVFAGCALAALRAEVDFTAGTDWDTGALDF